ncbi:MAG TPA: VWA domain-containing protein [Phycisphaerales bacterium]|nr:VWA domain-containing protein [Phycisphaerales bacterium]
MAQGRRNISVKRWAWGLSIVFHVLLLVTFAFIKFSAGPKNLSHLSAPVTNIKTITAITNLSPIVPKPKVNEISHEPDRIIANIIPPLPTVPKVMPSLDLAAFDEIPLAEALESETSIEASAIEFFGQRTYCRKVCYVVDCSGSMQGMFSRVRDKLKRSIQSLQPDQYFYIIFFRGDRLVESGSGRLKRATPRAKMSADKLIDSVRPAGKTNALNALIRAMRTTDPAKRPPELIYFLTDGFDLEASQNTQNFADELEKARRKYAPGTAINTIGFWTQTADIDILKAIAKNSNGTFINGY